MFDYSKYENATPEQLVNALSLVEKKQKNLYCKQKKIMNFLNF
ncbi:hypothetical protein ACQZL6_001026 [Campylobacter jejuni]|nr:hypothetical protein [Campylobacter jejuni]